MALVGILPVHRRRAGRRGSDAGRRSLNIVRFDDGLRFVGT